MSSNRETAAIITWSFCFFWLSYGEIVITLGIDIFISTGIYATGTNVFIIDKYWYLVRVSDDRSQIEVKLILILSDLRLILYIDCRQIFPMYHLISICNSLRRSNRFYKIYVLLDSDVLFKQGEWCVRGGACACAWSREREREIVMKFYEQVYILYKGRLLLSNTSCK